MSQNMVCVIFYCAIKDDFQLSEELIHSLSFFSYFLIFLKVNSLPSFLNLTSINPEVFWLRVQSACWEKKDCSDPEMLKRIGEKDKVCVDLAVPCLSDGESRCGSPRRAAANIQLFPRLSVSEICLSEHKKYEVKGNTQMISTASVSTLKKPMCRLLVCSLKFSDNFMM